MRFLNLGITFVLAFVVNAQVLSNTVNPIKVDQFGYLPNAAKVAILSHPVVGFNANSSFTPGANIALHRASDDSLVGRFSSTVWRDGVVDVASGDQVWWVDFSSVTTPGRYYLRDAATGSRSEDFRIAEDVYQAVLQQAVRTFFYQRIGQVKQPPYADAAWADAASHTVDANVTLIDPSDPGRVIAGTERDLSGGWYDAGDFNKYVNYADGALHNLLFAYQERPEAWGDDASIPASGNGVPDLLDEIRWELDWLLRMQTEDGSVLHKVSVLWHEAAIPSLDNVARRYAPPTASATISAAGAYAHAALAYADVDASYAVRLRDAAVAAWRWLEANPDAIPSRYGEDGFTGFYTAAAEDCIGHDCTTPQRANRVAAAIYLLAATGEQHFADYILSHTQEGRSDVPFLNGLATAFLWDDGIYTEIQDALLFYTSLPNADPTLVKRITSAYEAAISRPLAWEVFAPLARYKDASDPYRAWLDAGEYHWGSNRAKAHAGNMLLSAYHYLPTLSDDMDAVHAAAGYLHYLHGVNPLGLCYLSNMGAYGAGHSIPEMYHLWFSDGSAFDHVDDGVGPPPGFLVGGPNPKWPQGADDATATGLRNSVTMDGVSLLADQPAAKTYKAWNTGAEFSWEINENSITYQAPYIRLLSKFVTDLPVSGDEGDETGNGNDSHWTPSGAVPLDVDVFVTSQWDHGYCATFELSAEASINHWDFALLLPGATYGIWGAQNIDLGDGVWRIEPVVWNHLIFVGDKKSFSACGVGDPDLMRVTDAYGYTYADQVWASFGALSVDAWFTGIYDNSYCMKVNITNLTDAPVTWREVRLDLPDSTLDIGWSGQFQMQGDELVINPVDWNADLNVGGDTTLGFCADGYNNIQLNSASIAP